MTEKLTLEKAEKKPSKSKAALDALRKQKAAVKLNEINPPKFREVGGRDYKGANIREFFNLGEHGTLNNYDFSGADLTGADFTGVTAQGCKFNGAKLTDAVFLDADVRWSDFTGSNFEDAFFAQVNESTGLVERAALIKGTAGGLE